MFFTGETSFYAAAAAAEAVDPKAADDVDGGGDGAPELAKVVSATHVCYE